MTIMLWIRGNLNPAMGGSSLALADDEIWQTSKSEPSNQAFVPRRWNLASNGMGFLGASRSGEMSA
jgi:hypothetical protein